MKRRDVIFGGLGLSALGVAEALRPRKRLILLKQGTIAEALPAKFGQWASEDTENLINPATAGRLTRALYSELVMRIYSNAETGSDVMLLAAYGDTQSDLLQLHRPESCYPAVGFTLKMSEAATIDVGGGAKLPIRRVVAVAEDRVENIVYWTRMGESLPQSGPEQREQRINNSIAGFVPDGILVRNSLLGDSTKAFETLDRFVPEMLRAIPSTKRMAFVGTKVATAVGSVATA